LAQDDLLVFAEEEEPVAEVEADFWNILIIDDEPHVHQVTRMVLRDLIYNNKKIKFHSAFSAEEAKTLLKQEIQFSLALVDVVMEEDDSGLKLVEYIRKDLAEYKLRLILRTGQPGFAPEKEVIINYDINDYKEKTELSAQKLTTSVISALRNYEHIDAVSKLNNELEKKVADRVADLNEANKKLKTMLAALQEDQEAGRIMQQKLLPEQEKKIQAYVFKSRFYPSMTLSGDFLDYFEINEKYIGFYIADVSGHGVSSAIVTVLLKNFIDNALEKFWIEGDSMILKPDAVCKRLNEELLREKLDKYLTIFYGIINTTENSMRYINCGQFPYPFMISLHSSAGTAKEQGEIRIIEGKGTPVGLFKKPIFRVKEMQLAEDFRIVMFSDGVLEILDLSSNEERDNYIYSLFLDNKTDIDAVEERLGLKSRLSFPDDLTFLVIEKNNNGEGSSYE
jgi:serine phosphatase RsbU (regulator of sigma subunit)